MRILLDSHCLLWWLGDEPMSSAAKAAITDAANAVYVSPASIWELEIKVALGKLAIDADLVVATEQAGMKWMPITAEHARAAAQLPLHHRDPFDRMLLAQAHLEACTIVTRDAIFSSYTSSFIQA